MFDERIDIKEAPKWWKIVFVDGLEAYIFGCIQKKDSLGRDVYEFLLQPFDTLVKKYNIGFDELIDKINLLTKMSYPVESIIPLNYDPSCTVWLCLLNFRGNKTPASYLFEAKTYLDKIEKFKMEITTKNAEIAYLKEQLKKSTINIQAYIKEHIDTFTPMMKQAFGGMLQSPQETEGMGGK